MNFLDKVMEEKKDLVRRKKKEVPVSDLMSFMNRQERGHAFFARFAQRFPDEVKIIAEIKRASPSRGRFTAEGENMSAIMHTYENAGARAISVLTEQAHFGGSLNDLILAKELTKLPVLRKDFIADPYEIYEAGVFGADAVLLIAEALDVLQIEDLSALAFSIGLDVLLEVHSLSSFDKIGHIEGLLTGVNCRSLETLSIDLKGAHEAAAAMPKDRPVIVESGIHTHGDIEFFHDVGVSGFLVGTSLMASNDPGKILSGLINSGSGGKDE